MSLEHPFLFLRHGETLWNNEGRAQGRLDCALSDLGRRQARAAAQALRRTPIRRVVASPLSRVRDTAEIVAAVHRLPVEYDDGLIECHLGAGEGQMRGPWLEDYWSGAATPEGGEPFREFILRAWNAVRRAVDRPGVLLVAHGGIWRAIMEHVKVEPAYWMPNGVPVRASPGERAWSVEPLAPLPPTLRAFTP